MVLLVLLALLLTAPSAWAATAALAPASGGAGERAVVWAYDLPPHSAVSLRLPDGRTRLLFADDRGRLATSVGIPARTRGRASVELRLADRRSAELAYRVTSAWSAHRAVEVGDWAGHTLRVRTSLDLGKLVTRAVASGLEPNTKAVATSGGRELGRTTADANGVATIRRRLPDTATGSLLALSAGRARLTAPLPTPPAVLAAVGDIACSPRAPRTRRLCRHADTASLAAGFRPDAAALLGDVQYESGRLSDFRSSFDRSWGQLAMPLRPTPGNHEYRTPGASGYFRYFAEQAPWTPPPWYAYNAGPWHVVALNSNCEVVDCGPDSEQVRWLRADLAAHRGRCTLAYWHHPRYSSGFHGSDARTAPFWRALHDAGTEIVLAGHDHDYERFAPQDANGRHDITGIRSFVVGTGGKDVTALREPRAPQSEFGRDDRHGVLVLRLYADAYSWRYVGIDGQTVDFGRDGCHD